MEAIPAISEEGLEPEAERELRSNQGDNPISRQHIQDLKNILLNVNNNPLLPQQLKLFWNNVANLLAYTDCNGVYYPDYNDYKKKMRVVDSILANIDSAQIFTDNGAFRKDLKPLVLQSKINLLCQTIISHEHYLKRDRDIWPYFVDVISVLLGVGIFLQAYRLINDGQLGFFSYRAKSGLLATNTRESLDMAEETMGSDTPPIVPAFEK